MRRCAVFQFCCDVAINNGVRPLEIMPVWIDVVDQAQFDKRIALNRDGANKFTRRNGNARGEVLVQALSPKTIPKVRRQSERRIAS
jgi:hypothetical protein